MAEANVLHSDSADSDDDLAAEHGTEPYLYEPVESCESSSENDYHDSEEEGSQAQLRLQNSLW